MARPGPRGDESFPTTNWDNVRAAGTEAPFGPRPALNELLARYWPALWAHLVHRKKVPPDLAEDVVQSFIERKILQRNLVGLANSEKGKFRSFLLTALDRFLIDCRRKDSRIPPSAELSPEVRGEPEPEVFDVAWALQVLLESLQRLAREYAANQRPDLWGIFVGRVLTPLTGAEPLSYRVLARQYGLDSDKQAANYYHTAKGAFQRCLRAELTGYAGEDTAEEMTDFRRILSEANAELVERLRIDLWKDLPEITMSLSGDSRINQNTWSRFLEVLPGPDDFAPVLQKVLAAPLPVAPGAGAASSGFGELLARADPPLELLEGAKDFAKQNRTDPESSLPPAVATVLYYACIAAALVRCGRRISRHDEGTLRQGFRWSCERPWANEALRGLFCEGLRALGTSEHRDQGSRSGGE
jgi:RNA polymerase sigma-70 factor (ECF subfamily)